MKLKHCLAVLACLSLALLACLVGCGEEENTTDTTAPIITTTVATTTSATTTMTTTAPRPKVALSFDDGPHNVRTKLIVDELAKYDYKATFFVVGNRVDGTEYNGREGLRYAIDAGCEIGIHGYTHKKYYNTCSDADYEYELHMADWNQAHNPRFRTEMIRAKSVREELSSTEVRRMLQEGKPLDGHVHADAIPLILQAFYKS